MNSIIVADDDPIFRKLMNTYLSRRGYEVIEDVSGRLVSKHVSQYSPCACFIDIIMDDKEGLETISELEKKPSRPRIVAVSSDSQYLEWAKDMGADFVLLKPVKTEKIDEILTLF